MKEFTINKLRHLWLFLLLSVVSGVAFAQSSSYDNYQAAFDAGGDVSLTGNVNIGDKTLKVKQNKTVNLNLGSYSLTSSAKVIEVESGATLTISGTGTIESTGSSAISFKRGERVNGTGAYIAGTGAEDATIVIEGGNIVGYVSAVITSWTKNNTVVINGGNFSAKTNIILAGNGTSGAGGHSWTINAGTFSSNSTQFAAGDLPCAIYAPNDDEWEINGGTFTIENGAGIVQRAGSVEINGGTFNVTGDRIGMVGDSRVVIPTATLVFDSFESGYPALNDDSQMEVNDGIFTSEDNVVAVLHGGDDLDDQNKPNVRIALNDGEFTGNLQGLNAGEFALALNADIDYNYEDGSLVVVGLPAEATYNAQAQLPNITVTYGGQQCTYADNYQGSANGYGLTFYQLDEVSGDYEEVAAGAVINAGEYLVVVNSEGDVVAGTFTINPFELTTENTTLEAKANFGGYFYDGNDKQPTFGTSGDHVVKVQITTPGDPIILNEVDDAEGDFATNFDGADYESAGDKSFTITGANNFTGVVELGYTINKGRLVAADFQLSDDELVYNGSAQQPTVEPADASDKDFDDSDYTVTDDGKTNVGNYNVTVTGNGNENGAGNWETGAYNAQDNWVPGAINLPFTITPKNILDVEVAVTTEFTYNGVEQKPTADDITVTDESTELAAGTDYTLYYEGDTYDYTNAGEKVFYIQGLGNYAGLDANSQVPQKQATYDIQKKDLEEQMFDVKGNYTYDGYAHPQVNTELDLNDYTATWTGATDPATNLLTANQFNVVYGDDNTEAGQHTVTFVPAENGNFKGDGVQKTINIGAFAITINAAQLYKTYGDTDAQATTSTGQVANYGDTKYAAVDFTIDDNSGVKTLSESEKKHILEYLEFHRANNDTSEDAGDHDYLIATKADMTGCNFTITIQHNTSKMIIRKAKLTIDVDVTVNANVKDTWKYYGDNDPVDANGSFAFTVPDETQLKNGDTAADAIQKVTRAEGEDVGFYDFEAISKNYDVTVTPEQFEIKKQGDLNNINIAFAPARYTYDGTYQQPKPQVTYTNPNTGKTTTLVEGTDYNYLQSSDYTSNRNVAFNSNGTVKENNARVKVTFIKNFSGNKYGYFTIDKAPLTINGGSIVKSTGDSQPTQAECVAALEWIGLAASDKDDNGPKFSATAPQLKAPNVAIVATDYQGVYKLVPSGAVADNYTITYEEGLLTYGVKTLWVIADNKSAVYGEDEKDLTATLKWGSATGATLTNTEIAAMENDLKPSGEWIYELAKVLPDPDDSNGGKDAGTYTIKAEGPSEIAGYYVYYKNGEYTISKKELVIKADTQSKIYGEPDPEFTVDVKGLQYGEQAEDILTYQGWWMPEPQLIYVAECTAQGAHLEDVGHYPIDVRLHGWFNASLIKNYTVTCDNEHLFNTTTQKQDGCLYITKRPVLVQVVDAEKYYGENDPEAWEVTLEEQSEGRGVKVWETTTGFGPWQQTVQTPDVLDPSDWVISREASRSDANRNGEDAGEYALVITHAKENYWPFADTNHNPNYEIQVAGGDGTLTINQAVLNVKAKDQGIEYGQKINSTYITDATDTKKYAYTWSIALDDDEKPMGAMQNENLIIKKATTNQDAVTLDDQIEDIISLTTNVTKVGVHKPAENPYGYELTELGQKNYQINFEQGYLTIKPLQEIPLNNEITLASGKVVPLKQVLDDHQNAKVAVLMPSDRAFKADTWYTLVLPFEIKVRDFSNALGYAVVDLMNTTNSKPGNLSLELITDKIPANTPFTVKVDEDITAEQMAEIRFAGKTIAPYEYATVKPSVTDNGGNTFVGTYEAMDDMAINEYFIYKDTGKFYHGGNPDKKYPIAQTEAYWVPADGTPSANVRITIQEPNGATTVIESVSAADADAEAAEGYAEGWYTINGIKLDAEPTTSGTYIFNGKKVFVK